MAGATYSQFIKPEIIESILGKEWINQAKIFSAGLADNQGALPGEGNAITTLYNNILVDESAQVLGIDDPIAVNPKTQASGTIYSVRRFNAVKINDEQRQEESKAAEGNAFASIMGGIGAAGLQYLDATMRAVIVGATGALTKNTQDSSGSVITDPTPIIDARTKIGDRQNLLDAGAIIVSSAVYGKLLKLGVAAMTANTYGAELQNAIVKTGQLPTNIVGLTPIIADQSEFAISGGKYSCYLVGRNALGFKGDTAPYIEIARDAQRRADVAYFGLRYAIGVKGMSFTPTTGEKIADSELATTAKWTNKLTDDKHIPLVKLILKIS